MNGDDESGFASGGLVGLVKMVSLFRKYLE